MASEFGAMRPQSTALTLQNGLEIEVVPMGTIQIFSLFRIITNGLDPETLANGIFDIGNAADEEESSSLASVLLIRLLMAIPNAIPETMQFLRSMVKPLGMIDNPSGKQEKERNAALSALFMSGMANPDPIDTVNIIERVISDASENLDALGKRLRAVFNMFVKTGQLKKSPGENSSED